MNRPLPRSRAFAVLPLALALTLALGACSEAPAPVAPPKVVRTLIVGTDDAASARVYAGDVRSRYETNLAFRLSGKVAARLVDAGAVVKAGQPLARLDAADAGLQAAQAEAQRSLAEADAKRFRDLRAKNFVSAAALDGKETTLKAAEAQAGLAKNQAAYTTLTADRAGVIAQVAVEPGQVVAAGQTAFRLAPDGEREVAIAFPENEVARFKPGMAAEVTLWSGADGQKPLSGKIREIAPMADPVTRTYAARVALPGVDPRLPVGQTASVRFPEAGAGKAIRLPLSAIFQQGAQAAVWIVGADNTVSLKPVTLGEMAGDAVSVTAGLSGGERIVAAGVHKLSAGEKVRLAQAVAEPAK